jgi:hypothetical protein
MLDKVQYSRLNSDGSMNSWQTAAVDGSNTFNKPNGETGRGSMGGTLVGVWGGYIYLAGGCTSVTASGICTAIASDVQLASINADGSLDTWNTMADIHHQRLGASFIAWQDNLYRFGGCSRVDTSTNDCYGTQIGIQYGPINQDGDASTVSVTQTLNSGNCQGNDPYDCNLPAIGDATSTTAQGGQLLPSTAIINGYLYIIGGCASVDCNSGSVVSGNISYVAISSDGKLKQPPSCAYLTFGAWCNDNVNRINGTTGIAAAGVAVFGGYIYVVGGLTGSANSANVYRNKPNSDGSLPGAWTAQTFSNLGVTTAVSYTFAYARANPSSATYPGNLYIFGGCGSTSGAGCTQYQTEVWKCNIKTDYSLEEANANDCDTAGQLQIDSEAGGGSQGLGIHAGAVYANYIYLVGGVSPNQVDRKTVLYAKFDNNNDVVAVSGSTWTTSSVQMNNGRRRGAAFGYNGYLYAVGGYEATSNAALDTIEYVKLNVSDGSLISTNFDATLGVYEFNQSAVTINQRWGLGLAVSNSYAYVIGGCSVGAAPSSCTTLDPTIQTFQVYNNDSGAPGGYSTAANLYSTDRMGASSAVYNGYLYIAGGCTSATDCTASTGDVQRAAIDANGAVGSWSSTTASLGSGTAFGQLEVAGGTLYYIGGQTGAISTAQTTVYYSTLGSGGDVTAWTSTTALPTGLTQFSSVVWNNRIYVTGGFNTSSVAQSAIYVSPQLSSGGSISSWTTTGMTAFNVARSGQVAIAYANNLYILGGFDGTNYLSDVQFAPIASTGTIGSWTYTTSLPTPIRQADGYAANGYMYLFGGRSSTNDCTARTLIAPISANTSIASGNNPTGIGEWYQTNRNFDGGRYGVAVSSYQGKAYVLGGGCQGTVMQDDFDATLDASQWTSTTGMTVGTTCQSTSTSNVLYMTDGASGANAAITKDVNLTSGGTVFFKLFSPTADGAGCYTRERETGFLGGSPSPDDVLLRYSTNGGGSWTTLATYPYNTVYSPLKSISVTIPSAGANTRLQWYMPQGEATDSFSLEDVRIIATGSTSVSYAQDRVAQTTLLSQPQVAVYSRLVDAGNDAFPTKFLLNGLDNSIGARWQMAYRSMNDTTNTANPCGGSVMTGFGAGTNFGDVTLGTPGTYTMKNGAGTDIGCGRYFFMTVSIDASQTYGYPDDITRGPTLDNLTLFYNSNPGKRLIHGKTFTEGIQQPLDTQP